MKILIAEDDFDSRLLVSDIVEALGYTPILAENGRVALDKTLSDLPDLVILDVNMPEMDGFEVCAQMKRHAATATVPVIMLTAQTDIDSRVAGLGVGADDYVDKPFHPRELIARIESRLRAKGITDDLAAQREMVRRTFERFVAHEIVEKLLENPAHVTVGGVETIVTVLFADLEGFTAVASSTHPTMLFEVLNRYHGLIVENIKANGGTVDKFLGDGVMALYNTPLALPDHALRAVRTALSIREALPAFHQTLDPVFRLDINFGIHTGPAMVGNVGTPDLMDYTAIGDTVNLASRLQHLSKGSQIMISETTLIAAGKALAVDELGPVAVRGRSLPVIVYQARSLR